MKNTASKDIYINLPIEDPRTDADVLRIAKEICKERKGILCDIHYTESTVEYTRKLTAICKK